MTPAPKQSHIDLVPLSKSEASPSSLLGGDLPLRPTHQNKGGKALADGAGADRTGRRSRTTPFGT